MKIKKNIILLAISLVLIVLFFSVSCYKYVLQNRLLSAFPQFLQQKKQMDPEFRRRDRWQSPYAFAKSIQKEFDANPVDKLVLLIPPAPFFKKNGMNFNVPEPIVFYYYCGIKSVEITSDNIAEANFVVYPVKGKLHIGRIYSAEELQRYITFFKS